MQDRGRQSQQQQQQQQMFPQVRGRCGPRFALPSGAPTRCEAGVATCCSARGWCTNSPDDCLCDECIYYEWEEGQHTSPKSFSYSSLPAQKLLPSDLPLDDDNSDFSLHGYQNFLIEPKVRFLKVLYSSTPSFRSTVTTTTS